MTRQLLVVLLTLLSTACESTPTERVASTLLATPRGALPERVALLALDFGVGESKTAGVLQRDARGSATALAHLVDALPERAGALPGVTLVATEDDPPPDTHTTLDDLIERMLRTTYPRPDWRPRDGVPTLDESLGPVLADWGEHIGADGLLVLRGESVLPQDYLDPFDHFGEDDRLTDGFIQLVALLVHLPTGDVLWMNVRSEHLGGYGPQPFTDVRKRWAVDQAVEAVLEPWPRP